MPADILAGIRGGLKGPKNVSKKPAPGGDKPPADGSPKGSNNLFNNKMIELMQDLTPEGGDSDAEEWDGAALLDVLLGELMAHGMEGESATGSALCNNAPCEEFKAKHREAMFAFAEKASERLGTAALRTGHSEATTLLDAIKREVE
jgi:hypothetical protein